MKAKTFILTVAAVIALSTAYLTVDVMANRGDGALGTVYVTSQGLYYDTFVSAQSLPPHGPFQLLVGGVTEFGPGDQGYVGGRWKIPDGYGGYTYLLCPLLPPGREAP
ncbi:MAG: hypothetical protein ABIF19_14555 [Planctomycetota bacterium]